jgi:hypothetical protein
LHAIDTVDAVEEKDQYEYEGDLATWLASFPPLLDLSMIYLHAIL